MTPPFTTIKHLKIINRPYLFLTDEELDARIWFNDWQGAHAMAELLILEQANRN